MYSDQARASAQDSSVLVTPTVQLTWSILPRKHFGVQKAAGLAGHTDAVLSVALVPRTDTAFTASADGTVLLWDLRNYFCLDEVAAADVRSAAVRHMAAAPDGQSAVSIGTPDEPNGLLLWDLRGLQAACAAEDLDAAPALVRIAGKLPTVKGSAFSGPALPTPGAAAWSLTYMPGGDSIAVGYSDGTVAIVDISSAVASMHMVIDPGTRLGDLHAAAVRDLAPPADTASLFGSGVSSKLYSPKLTDYECPMPACPLVSVRQHTCAVGCLSGACSAPSPPLGPSPRKPPTQSGVVIGTPSCSGYSGSMLLASGGQDGSIHLWDVVVPHRGSSIGKQPADVSCPQLKHLSKLHVGNAHAMVASAASAAAAGAQVESCAASVQESNQRTGCFAACFGGADTARPSSTTSAPHIATSQAQQSSVQRSESSMAAVSAAAVSGMMRVTGLAFTQGGRWLVSGDSAGQIVVWCMTTRSALRVQSWGGGAVHSLGLLPPQQSIRAASQTSMCGSPLPVQAQALYAGPTASDKIQAASTTGVQGGSIQLPGPEPHTLSPHSNSSLLTGHGSMVAGPSELRLMLLGDSKVHGGVSMLSMWDVGAGAPLGEWGALPASAPGSAGLGSRRMAVDAAGGRVLVAHAREPFSVDVWSVCMLDK